MVQSRYGDPLNQGKIAPPGLPDPYGSSDDTRAGDNTELHALPDQVEVTDETAPDVMLEYLEIRPPTETPRFAPEKQLFYFSTPISIDANIDIPFKAQTLRFDNYSVRWVFVLQLRRWIPPMWYGAVFNATGLSSVTLIWQAPPGNTQPAPIADQIITGIAYLERCPEVAGVRIG